jgi:hypothetical protein
MVAMVLQTGLFPAANGNAGERTSLLDRVDFWGKERSKEQLEELQTLARSLDPLTIPPLSTTEQPIAANALTNASDRPFHKLLNFVNAQREKREAAGKPLNTQEWQDILFLDLALGRDHSDCQTHAHSWSLSHYHTGFGKARC